MADYLEGDLSLDRRAVFDAHLDGCDDCRNEVEELRSIPHLLRGLPDVEPPEMLATDVMRRIRQGEAAPTLGDRLRALLSELASPGIAIPSGAMVAAFVLALTSGQFQLSPPESTPRSAASRQLAPIPPEAAALASDVFRRNPAESRIVPRGQAPRATGSHAYFQLLPASTAGGESASEPRVQIVVRPSLADEFASGPRSADDWLAVVLHQPAEFVRRQASLSLAEREHWVRVLANRAVATGSADRVVEALQRRGGAEAVPFARAFAAEAQLASSRIARSR
jgi:hypothetical protein